MERKGGSRHIPAGRRTDTPGFFPSCAAESKRRKMRVHIVICNEPTKLWSKNATKYPPVEETQNNLIWGYEFMFYLLIGILVDKTWTWLVHHIHAFSTHKNWCSPPLSIISSNRCSKVTKRIRNIVDNNLELKRRQDAGNLGSHPTAPPKKTRP